MRFSDSLKKRASYDDKKYPFMVEMHLSARLCNINRGTDTLTSYNFTLFN